MTVKVGGVDTQVKFELGNVHSHDSTFFVVYELKSTDGLPLGYLRSMGIDESKPLVIKVLNRNGWDLLKFAEEVPGIDDHVVARLLKAQDQLNAKDIPHLKIAGFDEANIIVQEKFAKQDGVFELLQTGYELSGDEGKARAFLKLIHQLIDADLGWLDPNFKNVYFKKQGGQWVAGILDQDFVGSYKELTSGVYGTFLEGIKDDVFRIPSLRDASVPRITDLKSLMYKMFERYGWVDYDPRTGRLLSKRLKIEDLKRVFPDMPLLDPSPVVLPKRSQRWPLGFGALRDRLDDGGAGPRRAFLGRPAWAAA